MTTFFFYHESAPTVIYTLSLPRRSSDLMSNNNEELTDEDKTIIESVKDLEYMVLINKVDLETKIDLNEVKNLIPENNMIEMSLTENQGIDVLEQKLVDRFFEGELASKDMTYVSNARHIDLLE